MMSQHSPAPASPPLANAYASTTGQNRRTLDAIFRHPVAHNLAWRDVVALLTGIGDIDHRRSGEYSLHAGGEHIRIDRQHDKDVTTDNLIKLRHLLTRTGWAPDAPPLNSAHPSPATIIVIDHTGAKVLTLAGSEDDLSLNLDQGEELHHFVHHIKRIGSDSDREETFPSDTEFFSRVADAIGHNGRIVLIGHGKGQSNEAHHLSNYLQAHNKDAYARIATTLVADLSHLTTAELLQLGRKALI